MTENENDTRGQILDVAQDLIQRRGLNAMSFQDLSDAVGIRKASVHYHFPSKAEMVNALITRYHDDFEQTVVGILRSDGLGKTKLKRYCQLFLQTLQKGKHEKSCLCGMLAAEMYSLDEDGVVLVRKFMRGNSKYIREMIKEGSKDGSLSKVADTAGTAEMVLATLEGGLLLARCDGGPKHFSDTVKRMLALLSAT